MSDDLTKLTVNLVPRAVAALQAAAETTGDTRTDTVNRALQMYATLCAAADSGYVQFRFQDSTGRWIPVEVNRPRWRFWKLNEPLGWYCTRYWDEAPPTNPSLYFDDGLRLSTAWGPLTVTAVREPEPPAEPEPVDVLDLVRQYGHEGYEGGVAAAERDEEADDYHDGKARRLYDRIEAEVNSLRTESGCRHYDRLLATLGAENVTTALAEIERLKADAPDPLVLSLPQVPPGTQALIGGTTGERYNFVAVDGSWRPDTDDPDGFGLNLAEVLEREGSVTVVKREPRTWPMLAVNTPLAPAAMPEYVTVQGWGTYGRREDGLYANTDGYPDDVWRGHCLTFDALRALGDVTEVFDDEPGVALRTLREAQELLFEELRAPREPRTWSKLDPPPDDEPRLRGASGTLYAASHFDEGVPVYRAVDDLTEEPEGRTYSFPVLRYLDGPLTEVFDNEPGGAQ